jgi:hypothetical protein
MRWICGSDSVTQIMQIFGQKYFLEAVKLKWNEVVQNYALWASIEKLVLLLESKYFAHPP